MSETIVTKRCYKCKDFKHLSEFYSDKSRKDGKQYICKVCIKQDHEKYHSKEHYRKITKAYHQTDRYKKMHRKRSKEYRATEEGKKSAIKSSQKQRLLHPCKIRARNAVNNAVGAGKLLQPSQCLCHRCGREAKQYHHTNSYAMENAFDIIPLCIPCHKIEHYRSPI